MNHHLTVVETDITKYERTLKEFEAQLDEPVSFLQSCAYGKLQSAAGKLVTYILIEEDGKAIGCGLGIRYVAPFNLSYLYFPYGPVMLERLRGDADQLKDALLHLAKEQGCSFVRLDTPDLTSSHTKPVSNKLARMSSLQPRLEWALDISGDLEPIWMAMHKHARYNVRLAERANAEIAMYNPNDAPLDTFYELMSTTADRDTFSIFDKSYYDAAFKTLRADEGFVAICTIDGKPAAAALFIVHDGQAHYVFAGSSNDFRKIAPPYFLIWHSMHEAKRRGCTLFNFGGIQDPVKRLNLSGVTSFKKRFGGYEITHANPADLVAQPLRYNALKLYKSVR